MAKDSIVALAFLKVHWDAGRRDYLDTFVPLVAEVIRESGDDIVSLPEVQNGLREHFGLVIPLHPLNNVINRARRAGFLRKEHGVFYPVKEALDATGFRSVEAEVRGVYDRVVGALRPFARDHFSLDWTAEKAEQALLDSLTADGTTLLFASYEGRALDVEQESGAVRYVVSSFICHAQQEEPLLFESLETLAKGLLLVTALFLPRPGAVGQRFKNTTIYLDTSLLIYVAGCAGPGREAPAKEVVELLHHYGAKMRYFTHTMDEVRGILDANLRMVRSGRMWEAYGPIIDHVVAAGMSASDLELMAARLPEKLRFLRIEPVERPSYQEQRFVVEEKEFEAALQEEIRYHKDRARVYDVDSIAAIARARRGRESFAVETCRALFLTTNGALARITRRFFQPDATFGVVPLCLTDQALASVLWLKGPTAAPDLPRNLLVSNALAAMQPSNDFWKRYLAEIARLETDDKITETDYDILRYSITAKRAVMDLTRGDIDAFTEGTIDEVLRRAEANVRADLELELADETERRNRLEEDLAALREEIRGRDRRGALRAQIQRERTALTARDIARRLMYVPRFGLRLLLVAGVVLTFPWDFPGLSAAWVPYLISGVLAVFLALQLVDAGFGLSLKDLMGRLEGGLAGWLEEKMTWLRPLEEDDPALGARDALLPSANVLTALPPPATHTAQQDVEG